VGRRSGPGGCAGEGNEVFASIITPTFGRPEALGRALASVCAQDMPSWELIVVDDGEGEGLEVATAFGDPRIRACRNAGRGQVDARTTGIACARGSVVCWLDDDDWWSDPGHLSLLRREPLGRTFAFRGGWIVYDDRLPEEREVFDYPATERSLRIDNTVLTSSIAYPRAAHRELGLLDRELGGYCDWDFMLRMADAGFVPRKLAGLGVCYALHAANTSTDFAAPARRAGFERFAAKHALDIVIANHLRIHTMRKAMSLPDGWNEVEGALQREFGFAGFAEAIAFVNRVAALAEAEDHHPDIQVSFNRVTLRWRTHSADAVTDRDRELAGRSAALA
jgi:pterin-4a-carbinolamine dehydratase